MHPENDNIQSAGVSVCRGAGGNGVGGKKRGREEEMQRTMIS